MRIRVKKHCHHQQGVRIQQQIWLLLLSSSVAHSYQPGVGVDVDVRRRRLHPPVFVRFRLAPAGTSTFATSTTGSSFSACSDENTSNKVPSSIKSPRWTRLFGGVISFLVVAFLKTNAAALPVSKSTLSMPCLGISQIAAASSLIALLGGLGLSWRLGLGGLARQLLVACARCTIQLQLLGGIILQWIFLPTQPPWIIMAWIIGVGCIAAQESYGRLDFVYPNLRRHVTLSFLAGGLSVLAYALAMKVFGPLSPWYQPKALIPVAGMLFGNTLSAATLGASSLTGAFATQQAQVELALSRGATYQEAVFPFTEACIKTALTPTINALSVTGIVHLPGMMTGQILAGQSPRQAAIYQTVIWLLIASVATATVQILALFITDTLVDKRHHRLRLKQLVSSKHKVSHSLVNQTNIDNQPAPAAQIRVSPTTVESSAQVRKETQPTSIPILSVRNLAVDRAKVELSLNLHPNDRLGITGASGIGKSQILRTIVGLESSHADDADNKIIELNGVSMVDVSPPVWRTKICLVSQDRPALGGSPRDLFESILQHQSQRARSRKNDPMDIAVRDWNLKEKAFDSPWSTLSGGEAQRVSLAIALALEPDILLLDEVTSALDSDTALLVEKTLKCLGIPVIMVTHNREQLDRFCTHQLDLSLLGQSQVHRNQPS